MRKFSLTKSIRALLPLISVFGLAILIRFLYFPKNVYFSFDQARDFYFAQDILKGDLRLIGPPSAASPNLFAGPLALYIYAFFQLFFGMNPVYMSIFFRLCNAFGAFLVFLIGKKLFDNKVGLLAAVLYALSYEESQYSLLMSHQPLAVLSNLLLYLGLTMYFFNKKTEGFIIAALGLGLSIQFHFVYLLLFPVLLLTLYLLRKKVTKLGKNTILISLLALLIPNLSYLASELKFGLRSFKVVSAFTSGSLLNIDDAYYKLSRFVYDTIWAETKYFPLAAGLVLIVFIYIYSKEKFKSIFLLFWFLGGIFTHLITGSRGYYYSAAATVSLLIALSYIITKASSKYLILRAVLLIVIIMNSINMIKQQNLKGPNLDIVIQPGMLIGDEMKILDYIYTNAQGEPFSVRSLTVPLKINTTWSYLFEWYGQERYGYLPVWAEKPAEGFPGNMKYEVKRSELPQNQFVIVEPLNGIRKVDEERFFAEENIFTEISEELSFGNIIVQKRSRL